uniref:Uncharacterized protein n=1 Tax=viral metagenome TaxID=1070528 RepID=A0A6C0BCD1_9ZZZZ
MDPGWTLFITVIGMVTLFFMFVLSTTTPVEKKDEKKVEKKEGYSVIGYRPMNGGCGCKYQTRINRKRDDDINVMQISSGDLYPKNSSEVLGGMLNVQNLKYQTVPSEHT